MQLLSYINEHSTYSYKVCITLDDAEVKYRFIKEDWDTWLFERTGDTYNEFYIMVLAVAVFLGYDQKARNWE